MANFGTIFRIANPSLCGYRNCLHSPQWIFSASYAQSAEYRLGINKPKKPLTAFFKFAYQVRPTLLSKNPDADAPEIMKLASKHWQQLGDDAKNKMTQEYVKEYEEYKKKKTMYEASLTPEQKDDIKKMKEDMAAAKEKKKFKAELKELGRPKRPMSAYILFAQSLKDQLKDVGFANYHARVSEMWSKLSQEDKSVWEEKATSLREKYRIELSKWEQKMLRMGNINFITRKALMQESNKSKTSTQE